MFNIEVLVATMHKNNKDEIINLLNNMNIKSDSIIVNQCDRNFIDKFEYKTFKIICIYTTERGLSKSRNLALKYATAEIVVIADDDIVYNNDYVDIIQNAYKNHKNYEILTFMVNDMKKYCSVERKINKYSIHGIISYEISMKLSSIKDITFNEYFGTGSPYFQCGEECIFLSNCIKKKKRIMYIPNKIAYLQQNNRPSTWFTGYNKEYMIWQGAVYYELSKLLSIPFIMLFAIRKFNLYKNDISIFSAIKYLILGIKEYKKIKKLI